MDLGLKGKLALVTGTSEGIGEGVAEALAREGTQVAICAHTKSKLEAEAANSLSETGSNVFAIPADMRSLEGCESFVEAAAERLGGVDILINIMRGPPSSAHS